VLGKKSVELLGRFEEEQQISRWKWRKFIKCPLLLHKEQDSEMVLLFGYDDFVLSANIDVMSKR